MWKHRDAEVHILNAQVNLFILGSILRKFEWMWIYNCHRAGPEQTQVLMLSLNNQEYYFGQPKAKQITKR